MTSLLVRIAIATVLLGATLHAQPYASLELIGPRAPALSAYVLIEAPHAAYRAPLAARRRNDDVTSSCWLPHDQ